MPPVSAEPASLTLRELRPADAAGVDAIVAPEIERSSYSAGVRAAVDAVLSAPAGESRGLVAIRRERVVGVIVFGGTAGSLGAGRIQLIAVARDSRRSGIASALIDRALEVLTAEGMRAVFIELPDDPALSGVTRLLVRCGFRVDARVADFFRDGVDLAILRHDFGAHRQLDDA